MAKCVDIKKAWDFGVLCDWFINSIDETEPPCWTPEHIEELLDGFYVIPKRKEIAAPVFDAEPVMQWISVKDRLPEKSGYYLYFSKYPHGGLQDGIGVSYFQHKVKEWKKVYTPTVTHWMPLPEPPNGE